MSEIEAELALLIVSPHAPRVLEDIARLTVLAEFVLLPEPSQSIRDLHFDTASLALAAQRLSLRVRTVASQARITLKGPSRSTSWGGMERAELEAPWSPEALAAVTVVLARHGVVVPPGAVHPEASPVVVLQAHGFRVVQERDTLRRPRRVTLRDDVDRRRLAELAVDAVTYRLRGGDVGMCQVEIESKAEDGPRAAAVVAQGLMARFGRALRPWPHSKLVTGRAIEAMRERGGSPGLLLADQMISPAGVDLLAAWLARELPKPDNRES